MRGRYQGDFSLRSTWTTLGDFFLLNSPTPGEQCQLGFALPKYNPPGLPWQSYPWGKPMTCALASRFFTKPWKFAVFAYSSITMNESRLNYSGRLKGWVKWQRVQLFPPARDFPYDSNFIPSPRSLFVIFASRELHHQSTKNGQSKEKKLQKPSNALQL